MKNSLTVLFNKLTNFFKPITYVSLWLLMLGAFASTSFGQYNNEFTVTSQPTGTVGQTGNSVVVQLSNNIIGSVNVHLQLFNSGGLVYYRDNMPSLQVTNATAGDQVTLNFGTLAVDTYTSMTVLLEQTGSTVGIQSGLPGFTVSTSSSLTVNLSLTNGTSPIAEDGGSVNVTATVTGGIPDAPVTVGINWTGSTADVTGEADITISSGQTTGSVTITGAGDTFLEGNETLTATLSGTYTYTGTGTIGNGTTTSKDITILDAEYIELYTTAGANTSESAGNITVGARISNNGTNETGGAITVNVGWDGGTAKTTDSDFSGYGDFTIATSGTSDSKSISITDDNKYEGNETLAANITGVTGAPVGTGYTTGTVGTTIQDNETISISRNNATIAEDGSSTVTFTAGVDGGGNVVNGNVTVNVAFTTGTGYAATTSDFTGNAATMTITDGNPSTTMTLTSVDDNILEGDETIEVTISSPTYGSLSTTSATSKITDGEKLTLSANNTSLDEDAGTTTSTITATVSGTATAAADITITLDFTGSTAEYGVNSGAGKDFHDTWGNKQFTLGSGGTSASTTLTVDSDSYLEGQETIVINASASIASIVIDGDPLNLTISDAETLDFSVDGTTTITEAQTSKFKAAVSGGGTLNLSSGGNLAISLAYTGTAAIGTDFNNGSSSPETMTLINGTGSITQTITPVNDTDEELDETVIASASTTVTGLNITGSPKTITIVDDVETVLSSPADGATSQALDVTLNWNAVAGANQYKLYVNKSSGFGSGTAVIDGVDQGNVTSDTPGGLEDFTTYYWKVVPRNATSSDTRAASSTEVRSFTTAQVVSGGGSSPANNSSGITLTPTFQWTAVTGTDKYHLEVDDDPAFTSPAVDETALTSTSFTVSTPLAYNTKYYWRVSGSSNLKTSSTQNFKTILKPITLDVKPASDQDMELSGSTLNFQIDYDPGNAASGAKIIFQNRKITSPVSSWSTWSIINIAAGSSWAIVDTVIAYASPLLYNQEYEWKILLKNKDNPSDKKTIGNDDFKTKLAQPNLISIGSATPGASKSTNRYPVLNWTLDANYTDVHYTLNVDWKGGKSADTVISSKTTPFTFSNTTGQTSVTYTYTAKQPLGRYSWYVVADDAVVTFDNDSVASADTYYYDILPVPDYPVNTLTGIPVLPTFRWFDGDVQNYEIQVTDTSGNYSNPIVLKITNGDTTITPTEWKDGYPLENGKWYWWRVLHIAASDTFASVEWKFKTVESLMPVLDYPVDNDTLFTLTPTMIWHVNDLAVGAKYNLEYSKLKHGIDLKDSLSINNLSATTYSFADSNKLDPATKYYWRVRSFTKDSVLTDLSPIDSFFTGGRVVTPNPSWPDNHANVYTSSQYLYWYVNLWDSAYTYEVDIIKGTDTTDFGTSTDSAATANTYLRINNLLPATTYTWRVRTKTSYATSAWSDTASFYTAGAGVPLQPQLSYPVDSAVVYTTSPMLYWYVNGNGTGLSYEVWTRVLKNPPDSFDKKVTTDSTFYRLTGLQVGKAYEWYVKSKNSQNVYSSPSVTDTFLVFGSQNFTPKLAYPVDTVEIYDLRPVFMWYLNSSYFGVSSYRLQVHEGSADFTGSNKIDTTLALTRYFTSSLKALSYNKTYYWRVIVTDSSGGTSPSDTGIFKTVNPTGTVTPVASYPIDGVTIYDRTPRLQWYVNGPTYNVTAWKLTYSITQNFNPDPLYTTTVTVPIDSGMSYTIDTVAAGHEYFWKVQAMFGSTAGNTSAVESFVVQSGIAPIMPKIGGPDDVVIATASPVLTWYLPAGSEKPLTYELQYSESPNMSNSTVVSDISKPKYKTTGLTPGATYFWRVTSKDASGGTSLFSEQGSFQVSNTVTDVEDELIAEGFKLEQNYPNPFNPTTTIIYKLSKADVVTIKIYDMLGQEIRTLVNGEKPSGTHKVTWDGLDDSGKKVTTGMYIYRAIVGEKSEVRKMVLLK